MAVVVLVFACAVSAQIPAGWNYNPFLYYPYTALQPPVQDTPDVVAARASHAAAHAAARGRVIVAAPVVAAPVAQPVYVQPANTIQDTPDVWNAKVEFWRAYAAAAAANGVASNLPPLTPVVQANTVPQPVQDTPEVAAAKAEFFRAYNAAAARRV